MLAHLKMELVKLLLEILRLNGIPSETLLLDLLDVIYETSPPVVYPDLKCSILIGCPRHPEGHSIQFPNFVLL